MSAFQRAVAIILVVGVGLLAGFMAYRSLPRPIALQPLSASSQITAAEPGAAALADGAPATASTPRLPIPEALPDVRLPDLAGSEKSVRDFLGHPLIVNFWATWCAPCRREMPLLQQLRRDHRAERLEIVGIAVDFRTAVEDYQRRHSVDYPLLIGEDRGLAAVQQFGMDTVLPFSVFAQANGQIVAIKVGELHRDEADYILAAMSALAAGQMSLPQARAGIAERLKQLSIERAKANIPTS